MLTHSSSLCHLRLGKTPTFHVRTIFHFLSSNIRLLSLSSDFCKKMDHGGGYWAVLWRPRGGFWRGPCQEFSGGGGGGDLMFWEKISLLLLTIFEYTSSLGKYHSLLSALGFEICWRKKWKASRSRVEFQDSMMKILDLVSNYEIQWWKISISSRNMRFNDEKSRSRTTW